METATLNGRNGAALAVTDHTRSALDFAHALLQGTPEGPAALSTLLLDLAHAFGNVLTGILGFAELTLGQLPSDSLPHHYVKEVLQSGQQGARWVQKLQMFGRRRSRDFPPALLHAAAAAEEARVRPAWGPNVA